jgi:hypothetical protein
MVELAKCMAAGEKYACDCLYSLAGFPVDSNAIVGALTGTGAIYDHVMPLTRRAKERHRF